MSQQHVELVREFFEEIFCSNDLHRLQATHAEAHVSHLPSGDYYGPDGVRIDIAAVLEAFPDLQIGLEAVHDAGESVAYRFRAQGTHLGAFLGYEPTGRPVEIEGLGIDRFEDGKVVERWVQFDSLGILQQLGCLASYLPCR